MFKLPNSIKQPAARQVLLRRYVDKHFIHPAAAPAQMSAGPAHPADPSDTSSEQKPVIGS